METQRASKPGGKEKPWSLGDLGRRILSAMVAVSLVPLIVVAYQGYHCAKQAIVESAEAHLLAVLNSRKRSLGQWLKERYGDIALLASVPSITCECTRRAQGQGTASIADVCSCLDAVRLRSDAYQSVVVYDPQWKPLAATTSGKESKTTTPSPEHLSALMQTEGIYVEKPRLRANGSIGLRIGHVVRESGESMIGAVIADLDLSVSLNPLVQDRSGLGATGKVYLVDDELRILTEPFATGAPVALRHTASGTVRELAAGTTPRVRRYTDYLGRPVLAAAVQIQSMPWILVAEKDVEETLTWLGVLRTRALVTGLITLLIVVALALWLSFRIAQPLKALARVANRIRQGHLQERVEPLRGGEAEEVRRGFNSMLDELERSRQRLIQSATLASVGELSSRVVHEMRNPLSSIKLNLQALARTVHEHPVHHELATIASEQVERIERMLNDLLNYGRPLAVNPAPLAIGDLVADALKVVSEEAKSRTVAVTVKEMPKNLMVRADRELICRAISNLLLNAIQAVPPAGTVAVRTRRDRTAGGVVLEILDNGPGFSPDVTAQLFKPFFTTKDGGTGLGLANVKKIVELHSGSVSAANRPEGGAVFTLTIPQGGSI